MNDTRKALLRASRAQRTADAAIYHERTTQERLDAIDVRLVALEQRIDRLGAAIAEALTPPAPKPTHETPTPWGRG